MSFIDATRAWARRLKRDALTLWFARTVPATPWAAKMMAALVVVLTWSLCESRVRSAHASAHPNPLPNGEGAIQ